MSKLKAQSYGCCSDSAWAPLMNSLWASSRRRTGAATVSCRQHGLAPPRSQTRSRQGKRHSMTVYKTRLGTVTWVLYSGANQ